MQLTLTHLFRPKWQHPRADVRKKAIGNLDPAQDNDQTILETVAREDSDQEIRCQALKKITRADCLADVIRNDQDHRIQQTATSRLCDLVSGQTEVELPMARRLQLLEMLEQTDYLLHIVLKGDCFEIRQEALLRLSDQGALSQIINNADNRQLRQLAAEGITDSERLQQLIRSCRQRDKGVYRILKNRLDQQRADEVQRDAWRQTQEHLCCALEKLAEEGVAAHYGAKLQGLKAQWNALPQAADTVYRLRFDKAAAQCQLKADRYAEELAARQLATATAVEQQQRLAELQALTRTLQQPPSEPVEATLQNQITQLQARWQALQQLSPPAGPMEQQFQQLATQASTSCNAWQRYQALLPALEQVSDAADLDALLLQLDWPSSLAQPALLAKLRKQCAPAQSEPPPSEQPASAHSNAREQQQLRHQLALQQLDSALEQGALQQATDLIRPLRERQASFNRQQRQQYQLLNARYQDLQGWQKFATEPKLEQLCIDMQALAGNSELSDTACAEQLQILQQQWKQLDCPQVPNALRQRFQKANDQAYDRCRDFFEQLRQQRQQNLQQRERLCDQLEELLRTTDWSGNDLKSVLGINRQLRSDWRRFSPVERAQGKKLQKRFNRGLKALESELDNARQRNTGHKQALVEQAAALLLVEEATDAKQTARELQKQWKQLGPATKEQETSLWQAFNGHCEVLFSRIRAQRAGIEEQAREVALTLCQQLETAPQALPESVARIGQRFNDSINELADSRRLQQRFDKALTGYQLRCHPQDPCWPTLVQIEALLHRVEKPLLDQTDSDLEPLAAAQPLLAALSSELAPAMQQRLDKLAAVAADPTRLDAVIETSNDALRLLCVRLEILRNQPSPAQDQALRMEYQMSRLQDALLQDSSQAPCIEAVMGLQQQQLCIAFNGYFDELNERFNQLIEDGCQ